MEIVIGNHTIVGDGAVPPNKHKKLHENAKLSKVLDLSSSHALVQCSLLSTDMVFEGHDGAPVERNPNMSSRTCAVLEHRTKGRFTRLLRNRRRF